MDPFQKSPAKVLCLGWIIKNVSDLEGYGRGEGPLDTCKSVTIKRRMADYRMADVRRITQAILKV